MNCVTVRMMRKVATVQYWDAVGDLMAREGVGQRQAEHLLIVRALTEAARNGTTARQAIPRLQARWGLSQAMYYRRLARARQTICLP